MKQQIKIKIVGKYQYNPNDIIGIGTWGTVYKAIKSSNQQKDQQGMLAYQAYFKDKKKKEKAQHNNSHNISFTQKLNNSHDFSYQIKSFKGISKPNKQESNSSISSMKNSLQTSSFKKYPLKLQRKRNSLHQLKDLKSNSTKQSLEKISQKPPTKIQLYAIKRINKFKIQSSQASYQKYQNEVISLQKAAHIKQVIQFVDFFKSKSYYYIVTQYYQGSQDLFQYMEKHKNKFGQAEVRQIWISLLKGINSLHKIGIYHRDLKLQNVLYISKIKQTKIIDFGLAVCFPDPQTGNSKVGSPLFMSPQILFEQLYTNKCDIWSLGIIFYFMLFRTTPYGQNPSLKQIQQQIKKIKTEGVKYPSRKYISQECKQVIQSCLIWDEIKRKNIDEILKLNFFHRPSISQNHNFRQMYYQPQLQFKN